MNEQRGLLKPLISIAVGSIETNLSDLHFMRNFAHKREYALETAIFYTFFDPRSFELTTF